MEFIDVWENIFKTTVFPCVRRVFDLEAQVEIFSTLEVNLKRTIYLAAVFHEMGHRCGPWKVSPHSDQKLKINPLHWGIMGEIATDSQLSLCLEEFPEIPLFVVLQRLFWFGRRGINENPLSGMTNLDNDSWLGSYLWNKLVESKALCRSSPTRWRLNSNRLTGAFRSILREIDILGQAVIEPELAGDGEKQDLAINQWMKTRVE